MRRKTFDALVSAGGLVLVAVLLVAGVLLLWGHSYANGQVSSQLSAQKIVFPTTSNPEFKALPPSDQAAMGVYAGQPMTTGAQAKAYADHFIAVHLTEMGKGQTYSQLSAAVAGRAEERGAGRIGADRVPRHHTAVDAARGLRLLADGPDRPARRDRILRRRRPPAHLVHRRPDADVHASTHRRAPQRTTGQSDAMPTPPASAGWHLALVVLPAAGTLILIGHLAICPLCRNPYVFRTARSYRVEFSQHCKRSLAVMPSGR